MSNIGLVWIREDFRLENNAALSYATQNHDTVIAFFIYNNNDYDNKREAQKWWLYKSLESFKKDLSNYKINLQLLIGDELDIFSKIKKKTLYQSETWKLSLQVQKKKKSKIKKKIKDSAC